MRRQVLTHSLKKIVDDLLSCGIEVELQSFIQKMGTDRVSGDGSNVPLNILHKYMIATQYYSEDMVRICEVMEIHSLLDANQWSTLFGANENHEVHYMLQNVRFVMSNFPKILELTKQHYISEVIEQNDELPGELKGKTLLSVIIIEDKGEFSSPLRLTSTLGSITELYHVIATIEDENVDDLIVLTCDSGSDKSFDFMGLAKVMVQVKEIILSIWDRKVFHRQKHASECLNLIAESLPIIEKIADLEKNGSLAKEQAEILKRKAIKGATQFIEAGAIIPELESQSSHNPKQLMKPIQKLLVSPVIADSSNNSQNNFENEELSEYKENGQESLSEDVKWSSHIGHSFVA